MISTRWIRLVCLLYSIRPLYPLSHPSSFPLTHTASPSPPHFIPHPPLTSPPKTVAPATGTPETGGWSTRELRTILRGLEGINFIAADIVEVAPAYDTNAEHTTMAAADVLFEVMSMMVKRGPLSGTVVKGGEGEGDGGEL